ncbi:putative ferric-chelate reductase 1 homolog isoform X1 [Dermacentor silvarum]|uniref:putative ferric-chelate reductase 1 homolog isoform X1 n=1 Tax=Dermacentor silvarum TaxID=543639 RepID=UPI0021019637|nr:putative ferric-chelate reductase 1 homolog isoform X1 [Dermacentor silvarum]
MWIAAGISETAKMELTSVVECVRSGDTTLIRESWNVAGTVNMVLETPTAGIIFGSHAMTDGVLKCSWQRKAKTTVQEKTFDLAKNKYFVILAKGDSLTPTNDKTYHKHRLASKETLSFGEKRLAKSGSDRNPLILVHGNMMILAWLYLVSLAIMIARHFKPSWEGSTIMGDKVWFFLHRGLMATAVVTMLTSVAVIFYTSGGWNYSGNLHPILGVTAVVLGVCQPIMALFRCHPEEENRYIFNWMHWGNGNTAQLFAVTTIVFATGLKKANLGDSKWFLPVLALFVTFYVIVQLVFQIQKSMTQSVATTAPPLAVGVDVPMKPENVVPASVGAPLSPTGAPNPPAAPAAPAEPVPGKPEALAPGGAPAEQPGARPLSAASLGLPPPGTAAAGQEGEGFRKILLALYAVVSLVFAGILCGIVCTSAPPK